MITNVPRTAGYLFEEFVFRIRKFRTRENLDFESGLIYINNSITELYTILLPYKEFAYHSQMEVTHKTALGRNFYRPIRLIINNREEDTLTSLIEARKVTPGEWFTVTDWQRSQKWNRASLNNPIYTIFNYGVVGNDGILTPNELQILIAPNIDVPYPDIEVTTDLVGLLEYYGLPQDLVNETDVMDVPGLYEEYILNNAVQKFLFKSSGGSDVESYIKASMEQKQMLQSKLETMNYTVKRELESFIVPKAPYTPNEPLPGEFTQPLVGR